MCIYLKNTPDKFHPGPNWNDPALGFFEDGCPTSLQEAEEEKEEKEEKEEE